MSAPDRTRTFAAYEARSQAQLELARGRLATLQREALVLQQQMQERERARRTQARDWMLPFGAAAQSYCLRFLVRKREELLRRVDEAASMSARIEAGRQACMEADRRLASAQEARSRAEREEALNQARRDLDAADLAWLVRCAAGSHGVGRHRGDRP